MDLDQAVTEFRTESRIIRAAIRDLILADREALDAAEARRFAIVDELNAAGYDALVLALSDEDILTSSPRSPVDRATLQDVRDRILALLEIAGGITRGFPADIYVGPNHSPNGGISATVERVVVVSIDGNTLDRQFRRAVPTSDAPAVRLFTLGRFGATPVAPKRFDAVTGWMASGALLHSGDDRWRDLVGRNVVHLHDRVETGATSAALSD